MTRDEALLLGIAIVIEQADRDSLCILHARLLLQLEFCSVTFIAERIAGKRMSELSSNVLAVLKYAAVAGLTAIPLPSGVAVKQ